MKSADYEGVARQLAEAIFASVEGQPPEDIKHGARNKWQGASGYKHQIDVTVRGKGELIFIECKCWHKGKITVEQILVFAGRVLDVRNKLGAGIRIHPILVTTIGFQSGCKILADYFGIELCKVQSATEFAIRYKHLWSVGLQDSFETHDAVEAVVTPARKI